MEQQQLMEMRKTKCTVCSLAESSNSSGTTKSEVVANNARKNEAIRGGKELRWDTRDTLTMRTRHFPVLVATHAHGRQQKRRQDGGGDCNGMS